MTLAHREAARDPVGHALGVVAMTRSAWRTAGPNGFAEITALG